MDGFVCAMSSHPGAHPTSPSNHIFLTILWCPSALGLPASLISDAKISNKMGNWSFKKRRFYSNKKMASTTQTGQYCRVLSGIWTDMKLRGFLYWFWYRYVKYCVNWNDMEFEILLSIQINITCMSFRASMNVWTPSFYVSFEHSWSISLSVDLLVQGCGAWFFVSKWRNSSAMGKWLQDNIHGCHCWSSCFYTKHTKT